MGSSGSGPPSRSRLRRASPEGETLRVWIPRTYAIARCAAAASASPLRPAETASEAGALFILASLAQSGLELKSHLVENWTAVEAQSLVRHLGSWSLGKGSLQQKLV